MILVLSYNDHEQGTDPVLDWLSHKQANFLRVNIDDLIDQDLTYDIDVNRGSISFGDLGFDLDQINVIWLRRWYKNILLQDYPDEWPYSQLAYENNNELDTLSDYLFGVLGNKLWLSYPGTTDVNKLHMLRKAAEYDLRVPESRVVNNKKALADFLHSTPAGLISKPIYHSNYFVKGDYTYSVYTNKIDEDALNELPDHFFPTLFQERVDGEFEIRSFYLDGQFYSTSIICTADQMDVDLKVNSYNQTNNWVPYQLPQDLEDRLHQFLQSQKLNTGSIDIIKNRQGEYVFLEVNPVGQYSAPSYRCNYYVEERIADWLISKDHAHTLN